MTLRMVAGDSWVPIRRDKVREPTGSPVSTYDSTMRRKISRLRSLSSPTTGFAGGHSRQLTLELFFDTTESGTNARDVRLETDRIVRLTRIARKNGQPPVCTILWGMRKTEDFPFVGTISATPW